MTGPASEGRPSRAQQQQPSQDFESAGADRRSCPTSMSSSSSLELELAGLASLGARLGRLTDRTRWPHDVALGPRASGASPLLSSTSSAA